MNHASKRWWIGAAALFSGWAVWAACTGSDSTGGGLASGGSGGGAGSDAGGTSGSGGAAGSKAGTGGMFGAAGSGGGGTGDSSADTGAGGTAINTGPSVLQYHKNVTRDGVFVDAAFTKTAAAAIHHDATFNATMSGPTYAQPLYFEGGPGGKDLLIVATEQNEVTAFSATDGSVVWRKTATDIGQPVAAGDLPCGNINPLGISGAPAIDAASRTLFFDAMTGGGGTPKRLIYALSVDDGSVKSGWPIDVSAKVKAGTLAFDSSVQGERGALLVVNNTLYVPYGGHAGDCGNYHGWVVSVPIDNPAAPVAWATRATKGGIWSMGGVASDGTSVYVATGNTSGTTMWGHGEALMRFPANLAFSEMADDYFAPSNWHDLDNGDTDIGGSNPILFHAAGATPADLIVGLGKDGNAYLVGRDHMGGIGTALATKNVSSQAIINGGVAYTTSQATYVAFKGKGVGCPGGTSGQVTALKIGAATPPTIAVAWCAAPNGGGSPIVTTTDGTNNMIVWQVAAEGDNKLRGFDADTGAVVFAGGAQAEQMSGLRHFQTLIAAKGRIFVAGDDNLYAFTVQ